MIKIEIPQIEAYDEIKNEFINLKPQTLLLEHSLLSLARWESKWNKSFLSSKDKTAIQALDYIRCMTITQNVNPITYNYISSDDILRIKNYIDAPMTATTFHTEQRQSREIITAEIIYYWMVTLNIPFECQKWHLNRLMALINVCAIKNSPPKKMTKNEIRSRNAALNAARRKALHTAG